MWMETETVVRLALSAIKLNWIITSGNVLEKGFSYRECVIQKERISQSMLWFCRIAYLLRELNFVKVLHYAECYAFP